MKHLRWYVLLLLFLAAVGVWYAIVREEKQLVTIAFLDVGQGDATFIEGPSGRQLLIDGGADRGVLRELGSVMPFFDRSIDVVIATHPDKDHIGGLPDVLKAYDVDYIMDPNIVHDTSMYRAFEEYSSSEEGAVRLVAKRGQVIDLGGGAYVRILFPDRDVTHVEPNVGSVVAQLVYGDVEFMLTGDAPMSIEQYLLALDGATLLSDVLKVGHHGSNTSSASVFVSIVDPTYAVISAGKDNRYGHPHQEVLDTLRDVEVETLGTYEEGTIVFYSDGERIWME